MYSILAIPGDCKDMCFMAVDWLDLELEMELDRKLWVMIWLNYLVLNRGF